MPPQSALRGRPAVAGVRLFAGPREGRDQPRSRVDLADAVVPGVGEIDLARGSDRQAVHAVKRGLLRRPAVAGISFLFARPGDRREDSLGIDTMNMAPLQLDNEHRPDLSKSTPNGLMQLRLAGRRAVPLLAAAGHEHQPVGPGRDVAGEVPNMQ